MINRLNYPTKSGGLFQKIPNNQPPFGCNLKNPCKSWGFPNLPTSLNWLSLTSPEILRNHQLLRGASERYQGPPLWWQEWVVSQRANSGSVFFCGGRWMFFFWGGKSFFFWDIQKLFLGEIVFFGGNSCFFFFRRSTLLQRGHFGHDTALSELVTGSRIGFLERGLRDVYPCILAMQMGCFGATDGHMVAIVQGCSRGRTCQRTWKTSWWCVSDFLQPLPQKSANVAWRKTGNRLLTEIMFRLSHLGPLE